MKKLNGILLAFVLAYAWADSPPKISPPSEPPADIQAPADASPAPAQPLSTSISDPNDKSWKEYDNHIVKAHLRIKTAWTLMEVKETKQSGSVSFTLSRAPLVTVSIMRQPMEGSFESYMTPASLTPVYPSGFKKSHGAFAGRQAFLTRGKTSDDRMDESYFLTDGSSIYQVSFTAPEEDWKAAQPQFDAIKNSFHWLP